MRILPTSRCALVPIGSAARLPRRWMVGRLPRSCDCGAAVTDCSPARMPADMVERCLEVLKPADRDHCHVLLDQEFRWLMETYLNPDSDRRSKVIAHDLVKMAEAMDVVARYMQRPP